RNRRHDPDSMARQPSAYRPANAMGGADRCRARRESWPTEREGRDGGEGIMSGGMAAGSFPDPLPHPAGASGRLGEDLFQPPDAELIAADGGRIRHPVGVGYHHVAGAERDRFGLVDLTLDDP